MEFNHQTQKYEPTMADFDKCIKENQALKDRWQNLKSYLINTIKEKDKSLKYYKFREVLDKMEELEKGGK